MAHASSDVVPRIFLAFRFHVNFYHSYRGDTPDEVGFGKDIRIIRRIIEVLDRWNASGVPVRGSWDIENYFSLERIMPAHCPDLIAAIQRRVANRQDDVEVMSYNNGIISAHTATEFDAAISRALTNEADSGLRDIFGTVAPIVRPQEMMYTPRHLALYAHHGIECISLYYSGVPFNAFSNFLPLLPLEQRCNPLRLTYPGIDASMILLPAHNHGDVAEHVSFRRWLQQLRRHQLALSHPPLATITIAQDTADGSFDGYSSWAEKWSNHRLWTGIERARILDLQARRLVDDPAFHGDRSAIDALLDTAARARLLSLSTTHFGLASPVVNRTRLQTVARLVDDAVGHAAQAFALAGGVPSPRVGNGPIELSLLDYVRGVSTDRVTYDAAASRALFGCRCASAAPRCRRSG